jgi:hypothetical protein
VQGNHLHLLVEADDPEQLFRGMRGLCARLSRRLNQLFGRRRNPVFDGRYHARLLGSPAEVRWALGYVLSNYRKHSAQAGRELPSGWVDPFSSGPRFDGWTKRVWSEDFPGLDGSVIAEPQTWLLDVGWKKAGAIDPDAAPGRGNVGCTDGERNDTVPGGHSKKP